MVDSDPDDNVPAVACQFRVPRRGESDERPRARRRLADEEAAEEPQEVLMSLDEFERATLDDAGGLRARRWTTRGIAHVVDQLSARWTVDRDDLGAHASVEWAAERFDIPEPDL